MTQEQLTTTRKRRPLVEIVADLLEHIEDADGEVTDAIDYLELELSDKAEAYAAIIRQLTAEAEAFKSLATQYKLREAIRERAVERLKERLAKALEAVGVDKLKTPTCTVYFQSSEAVELDADACDRLPPAFLRMRIEPNKTAIKDALKNGDTFECARLTESRSLRLR